MWLPGIAHGAQPWRSLVQSCCSLLETNTEHTAGNRSSPPSPPGFRNYPLKSTSTVPGAEAHNFSPLPCSGEQHNCTDRAAGSSDSGCLCKNLLQKLACLITERKNLGRNEIKPVTHMSPFLSAVQQMHSATQRCWSALAQSAAKTMPQTPVINKQGSNLSNPGAWQGNHVRSFLCTAHTSLHPIATLILHSGLSHRAWWSSRFGHKFFSFTLLFRRIAVITAGISI